MPSEFSESHIFHEEDAGSQHHSSDAAHIFGPDDVNAALASTAHIVGDKTFVVPDKISSTMSSAESSEKQKNESPKNLFMQAYEAVRNTDKVSNIVDNVAIWWKGRHIDAVEKDIQRLEGLVGSQNKEASRHEERLQASDEAAAKLAAMKQGLGLRDTAPSSLDHREGEYRAVKGRAEAHRIAGEKIARELMVKRELKEKFEQGREEARSRIAERFENNINTNIEATRVIDSNIDQIQQNIGVAESIVAGLQDKQQVARSISNNPAVLSSEKTAARAFAQDLEGRIQDMFSKMQLQKDRIAQYENKKIALETQKAKWEGIIAKKPEPEQRATDHSEISDSEREESFAQETWQQIEEQEDSVFGDVEIFPEQNVSDQIAVASTEVEKDPRVVLLEDLQQFMQEPDMQKYNDPDFQELVLEQGTPEQKALLKANGFFTNLFTFLESPTKPAEQSEIKAEKGQLDPLELAREYDEIIDAAEDDLSIAALFDTENRKRIEQGGGTSQESLIVKLLNFFEFIFKNSEIRPEAKKKNIL